MYAYFTARYLPFSNDKYTQRCMRATQPSTNDCWHKVKRQETLPLHVSCLCESKPVPCVLRLGVLAYLTHIRAHDIIANIASERKPESAHVIARNAIHTEVLKCPGNERHETLEGCSLPEPRKHRIPSLFQLNLILTVAHSQVRRQLRHGTA